MTPGRSKATILLALALIHAGTTGSLAEIGDPTLRTDHPQYAGEGAFQTIEDCARFATEGAKTPQDQAIAMYLWLLSHQWHLYSPQECFVPGAMPDTQRDQQYDQVVYDANRARFSYGYGLCGTVHAWNEPYWRALGMNARRRAFPGHTNSEIEYDDGWHAFDTDMAGLVFRKDGVVAGYEDIRSDPAIIATARPPLPAYPFAWPGDRKTMEAGWREVAKGGNWYKMYHSGYAAQPGVVHLRTGETFTRYYDRDHFGGPTKRRFWHHQAGGPERDWTFFDQGVPQHDGAQSNCRSHATYANGEFIYQPDLTSAAYREGVAQQAGNVVARAGAGLRSTDGTLASVTFAHFSPYVICGDPKDDANPMTGPATGGLVVEGRTTGPVVLEISVDQGQSWLNAGRFDGPMDLTDHVKGRYGWLAKFTWEGAGGIGELRFTTVTQVCQAIYPRLKPGGTEVTYRAAARAVVPVLPNFGLPEKDLTAMEQVALRSSNVQYSPRTKDSRFAYRTSNNKPGTVFFRIDSPTDLTEVSAAVRFGVRVPPPEGCEFHLDVSLDEGKSWRQLGRADMPADNEYSSGWMYGRASFDQPGVRTVLVRAHLYAGGYPTGLIEAQLYGLRRTPEPVAATVTYAWREGGQLRQHAESIPAGQTAHRFTVPTGAAITDEWVRIQ